MWACAECDSMNDDEFPECAFCGAGRPPAAEGQPAILPVASAVASQEVALDFTPEAHPSSPEEGETVLVLVEARTKARVRVPFVPCVLGREGDCENELFSPRVSRIHLQVGKRDGLWTVTHLGTNSTTVFSKGAKTTLREGVEYPLVGGETLRIADMTFTVEFGAETLDDNGVQQEAGGVAYGGRPEVEEMQGEVLVNDSSSMTEGWFIDCRGCGRSYLVAGEGSRLAECPTCIDAFDKKSVARIKPVFGRRSNDVVIDVR